MAEARPLRLLPPPPHPGGEKIALIFNVKNTLQLEHF